MFNLRKPREIADSHKNVLNSLLELSLAINANESIKNLLQAYSYILTTKLGVQTLALFNPDEDWHKELSVGIPQEFGNNADEISSALLSYKDLTKISRYSPFAEFFDLVVPVFHKDRPIAYALVGGNQNYKKFFREKPILRRSEEIQVITNLVIISFENKRLYKKSLEQERLRHELEMASRLQAMLVPEDNSLPENSHIRISSFYQPNTMIGGDYYDFTRLSASNLYVFCIGDVSGKGVAAALLMSNFQANLRSLVRSKVPFDVLIRELNQSILENSKGDRFITFFIAFYNAEICELTYVNAGHNPPMLLHRHDGIIEYLTQGCVGLGMLDEIPNLSIGKIQNVRPTDTLLCYTDGLTEAVNRHKQQFGTEPLERILQESQSAENLVQLLKTELKNFHHNTPLTDDVTIMGVDLL